MGTAITTAVSDIVGVFTTNVVPLLKTEPFVYFLGISVFGLACSVFAMVKHTV